MADNNIPLPPLPPLPPIPDAPAEMPAPEPVAASETSYTGPAVARIDDAGNMFDAEGRLIVRISKRAASLEGGYMDPGVGGLDTGAIKPLPTEPPKRFIHKFKKNEIDDVFREWGTSAPGIIAERVADQMAQVPEYKGLFTYETLRDGTAPFFDLFPDKQNLTPQQRAMSDNDIVKSFTNAKDRSFFESLVLEAPKVAGGVLGTVTGAQLGAMGGRAIPHPAAQIALPALGLVVGSIAGREGVEQLEAELFGERAPVTPASRSSSKAVETAGMAIEGALSPLAIGTKGVSLGSELLASRARELSDMVGPLTQSRGEAVVRGLEKIIGKVGETARTKPKRFLAGEAAMGAVATGARKLQEEIAPGDTLAQLGAEVGAPLTAAVSYQTLLAKLVLRGLGDTWAAGREVAQEAARTHGREKPNLRDLAEGVAGAAQRRRDMAAAGILYSRMRANLASDEDITGLLEAMATGDISAMYDPKFKSLQELRATLRALGQDFTELDAAAQKNIEDGFMGLLSATFSQGTEEGYLAGSELARAAFEAGLSKDMVGAIKRLTEAYNQIGGERKSPLELGTILYEKYLEPALEKTRQTRRALYEKVPDHDLVFDSAKPPSIIGALQRVDYPVGDAEKGVSPTIKTVANRIRNLENDFNKVIQGVPLARLPEEVALQKAQTGFKKAYSDIGTREKESFEKYLRGETIATREIQRDSRGELIPSEGNIKILEDVMSALTSTKGPSAAQTRTVVKAKRDELRASLNLENARQAQASVPTSPGTLAASYRELSGLRSQLLDISRDVSTTPTDRALATKLADEINTQIMDLSVPRAGTGASSEEITGAVAVANAYTRARESIFRDGLWKKLSGRTPQGAENWEEPLLKAFKKLDNIEVRKIQELQRGVAFSKDPIGTNVPGVSSLKPFETPILADLKAPTLPPPSTDAALADFIAASLGVGRGEPRTVVVPGAAAETKIPTSAGSTVADILEKGATPEGVPVSLQNAKPLDLLPDLKKQLQDIARLEDELFQRGIGLRGTPGVLQHTEQDLKKLQAEKLWWDFGQGEVDFLGIMRAGMRGEKTRTLNSVWDQWMDPIREIQKRAADDPVGVVKGLKASGRYPNLLKDVPDTLTPEQARGVMNNIERESRNGLKALVFDYLKDAAISVDASGNRAVDWRKFKTMLFEPPMKGTQKVTNMPSIATWLQRNGMLSAADKKSLETSIDAFAKLDAELMGARAIKELGADDDPLKRLGVRVLGVTLGARFSRLIQMIPFMGKSGSIQLPGYAADYATRVLIDGRASALQDRLFELFKNPQKAAKLVRILRETDPSKPVNEAATEWVRRNVIESVLPYPRRAFFYLRSPIPGEELPEDSMFGKTPPAESLPNVVPVEPPVRAPAPPQKLEKQSSLQVPRFELPSQAAAMPAPRPTGQPNPQQRAGLAKMFPNDPILGAAGGIGSLMG